MGAGATIGGILGGAAGTLIAPGVGTQAGAMLGSSIGQGVEGFSAKKKAESLIPPAEYAMSRRFLNTLQRRRRALETGTAMTADRTAIRQALKTFGTQSFNQGGPVNTGYLSQLMSQGVSNLSNIAGQQYADILGKEQAQRKDMEDLRIQRSMFQAENKFAQSAKQTGASESNLMAILNSGMLGGSENVLGMPDPNTI